MFFPTSRRSFLKASLSSSTLIALSGAVPKFLVGAAQGAEATKGESVLVVIQLSGGNDGLNTVVPYADDVYRKGRPILGIAAKSVLKIDDYAGLHPSMDGFSRLLQQGRLGSSKAPDIHRPIDRISPRWTSGRPPSATSPRTPSATASPGGSDDIST